MPGIGIGNSIIFKRGGTSWSSYWETRTPSNLTVTIDSTTEATLIWDDGVEAADGYKLYVDDVYHSTIAYGVETKAIAGLTLGTEYIFKLVAYKGTNESDPDTETLSWAKWMTYSYTDIINTHTTWTDEQKVLIEDRLSEVYVVTTFGPAGANKTVCDFFIFFETFATLKTTSTTTKSGDDLRWNYGAGNIYIQDAMPAQTSTTEITVTSTDGFGGVTRFSFASGQFKNNIPNFPYYFPNVTNITFAGGTVASGKRLKGDISGWVFNNNATIVWFYSHDLTGDLSSMVVPDKCTNFNIYDNPGLIGDTPKFNATWSGTSTCTFKVSDCGFTGIGGTSFPYTKAFVPSWNGNYFTTAEITTLIGTLNTWYSAHAPLGNCPMNISGAYNGTITGGDANADLVNLKALFVTAGYTFTLTYNADTYILTPLDNPTLVVTMDDDNMTDYTKILPMLSARGKAGVSYRYDTWTIGHQTITEVNALIAGGWSIEAHPAFDPGMDEAAIRAIMVGFQTFFTNNSIPMFNHCAYGGGYHNALVDGIIPDYVDTARSITGWDVTPNTTNRGGLIYKDNDPYQLLGTNADPIDAEKVAGIKTVIDKAKVKSAGVIIYFHAVTDADVVLLAEIVDYAIAQGFDICTIDELYTAMTT
jgi:hypothetical protein